MFGPVRPTLHWQSAASAEQILERLSRALRAPDSEVNGLVTSTRIELHTRRKDQHLWSPQLAVDLKSSQDEQTHLVGRFSPHPNVWTMYVALSAAICFAGLMSGAYGYVQWLMDQSPWSLLGVPLSLFGFLGLYFVSQLGQSLGHDQMDQLVAFLETHADDLERSVAPSPASQ